MSSSLFQQNQASQSLPVNNQQMQMALNFLKRNGMTAEQAVKTICQQRGINVDEFMKSIASFKG